METVDPQLKSDVVTVKCPYCKISFPQKKQTKCSQWVCKCPDCGRIAMLPVGIRPPIEYQAPDRAAECRRELESLRGVGDHLFLGLGRWIGRPRTIIFVVIGVAIITALAVSKRRTEDPAPLPVSQEDQTIQNLQILRTALEVFKIDCGRYPTSPEGLASLVRNPSLTNWHGPYVDALKPDIWLQPYRYAAEGVTMKLFSSGPDVISGTEDDIADPGPDLQFMTEYIRLHPVR
jgi:general secretion pathway protein G